MKKVLGLDLGVSSIGWALVELDEQANGKAILGMGTRIVPLTTDEKTQFSTGNEQTKNRERTTKRGMRRGYYRYRLRREMLAEVLQKNNMFPGRELFLLDAAALYGLRAKAITEAIALPELGRILMHLNQKRGYKSNRKSKESKEDTEYLKAVGERERSLEGRTIGQFFYEALMKNPLTRIKRKLFYRATYIEEFDRIWEKQATFYPELTEELKNKIRNEVIYFQRKLKSQKHLVGGCEFESRVFIKDGREMEQPVKVAPLSSPLFQVCRLWQNINNIEITSIETKEKYGLPLEQKQKLFDLLERKAKVSANDVLKIAGFDRHEFRVNMRRDLLGNGTKIALRKQLELVGLEDESWLEYDPLKDEQQQKYWQLWHVLYSIDDPQNLRVTLMNRFGMADEQAEAVMATELKDGFGNLSSKAMKKLLPYLFQGKKYSESCDAVDYNHSSSITKEQNEARVLIPADKLELIQKGSLRNPAVERILNQVVNLYKEIVREYGQPDEIRIELARQLQQSADERKNTEKYIKAREKDNDFIRNELAKEPFFQNRYITMRDIEKYKLWREFDHVSPYNPNKQISLGELFSASYEVEHIIPKSKFFDDSFSNKTVAHVTDNREKDNRTAFDFMETQRASLFGQYKSLLQTYLNKEKGGISKAKYDRLTWTEKEIPKDFINRKLKETQYITRKAREMLLQTCRTVWVSSGGVTDYLRHIWGYEFIIHDLHFPKFKANGLTETITIKKEGGEEQKERIKDWNKRLDHRHHAVDALVIACTTQRMINYLNKKSQFLSEEIKDDETRSEALKRLGGSSGKNAEAPFPVHLVSDRVNGILISLKPGKRLFSKSKNKIKGKWNGKSHIIPRGPLHEQTVYGIIKNIRRIPVEKFKAELLKDVVYPYQKNALEEHLLAHKNDSKKAFSKKGLSDFKINEKPVTMISVYEQESVVSYPLGDAFTRKDCDFIVDKRTREAVIKRMELCGNNPKEAFKELDKNPIWVDEKNRIDIKRVRCYTKNAGLFNIGRGFVKPGSNHHVAIYRNDAGDLNEEVVTLFEAFERKRQGEQPIRQRHPEYGELMLSLMENEMFVFNMTRAELETAIEKNNYKTIAPNLFRVRKITAGSYWFNQQYETEPRDSVTDKSMNRAIQASKSSLFEKKAIKVSVSTSGKIRMLT